MTYCPQNGSPTNDAENNADHNASGHQQKGGLPNRPYFSVKHLYLLVDQSAGHSNEGYQARGIPIDSANESPWDPKRYNRQQLRRITKLGYFEAMTPMVRSDLIAGKFIDIDDHTTQLLSFANLLRLLCGNRLHPQALGNEILVVLDRDHLFEYEIHKSPRVT